MHYWREKKNKQGFFQACPGSAEYNKSPIHSGTSPSLLVFCPILPETTWKQQNGWEKLLQKVTQILLTNVGGAVLDRKGVGRLDKKSFKLNCPGRWITEELHFFLCLYLEFAVFYVLRSLI